MRLKGKPVNAEWHERGKNVLAQNSPATNSKRWNQYIEGVMPSHSSGTGIGPYLHDPHGNKYCDFVAGLGTLILGYNNQRIIEAAQRQCALGASHSLPTTLEVELAEMLTALIPSTQKVRFGKNGKDAAECAIKAARCATGRKKILSRGYHGCSDIFTSLTPPALGIKDTFEIEAFKDLNQIDDTVAAVIVEALELDFTEAWQVELTLIRETCKKKGVVFIIDEIITGFRVPQWTISNLWNLNPDIVLIGKAMASGFPLSACLGKREIMDSGEYFHSTTFGGEAVSLASSKATLQELQKRSFEDLMFYGNRLMDKLNKLHVDIHLKGWGTRGMLNTENPTTALFMQEMSKAGYLFGKAYFFTFAHLEENIEPMLMDAAEGVVEEIRKDMLCLAGPLPALSFVRKDPP